MPALNEQRGDVDTPRRPSRAALLGKVGAALGLTSALVHLVLLDTTSLGSLAMVAMALACLPCAWHLWRHPTASVWGATAAVDASMLLLHAQVLATRAHHVHGAPSAPHVLMWTGLVLVAGQLALAVAAAVRR